MRANRIKPAESPNPLYDRTAARLAKKQGKPYGEPEFFQHSIGEVVDDPHAWRLCVMDTPLAVPADAECAAKVDAELSKPKRQKFLRGLLKFHENPQLVSQLGKDGQAYVNQMLTSYANQLEELVTKPESPFEDVHEDT